MLRLVVSNMQFGTNQNRRRSNDTLEIFCATFPLCLHHCIAHSRPFTVPQVVLAFSSNQSKFYHYPNQQKDEKEDKQRQYSTSIHLPCTIVAMNNNSSSSPPSLKTSVVEGGVATGAASVAVAATTLSPSGPHLRQRQTTKPKTKKKQKSKSTGGLIRSSSKPKKNQSKQEETSNNSIRSGRSTLSPRKVFKSILAGGSGNDTKRQHVLLNPNTKPKKSSMKKPPAPPPSFRSVAPTPQPAALPFEYPKQISFRTIDDSIVKDVDGEKEYEFPTLMDIASSRQHGNQTRMTRRSAPSATKPSLVFSPPSFAVLSSPKKSNEKDDQYHDQKTSSPQLKTPPTTKVIPATTTIDELAIPMKKLRVSSSKSPRSILELPDMISTPIISKPSLDDSTRTGHRVGLQDIVSSPTISSPNQNVGSTVLGRELQDTTCSPVISSPHNHHDKTFTSTSSPSTYKNKYDKYARLNHALQEVEQERRPTIKVSNTRTTSVPKQKKERRYSTSSSSSPGKRKTSSVDNSVKKKKASPSDRSSTWWNLRGPEEIVVAAEIEQPPTHHNHRQRRSKPTRRRSTVLKPSADTLAFSSSMLTASSSPVPLPPPPPFQYPQPFDVFDAKEDEDKAKSKSKSKPTTMTLNQFFSTEVEEDGGHYKKSRDKSIATAPAAVIDHRPIPMKRSSSFGKRRTATAAASTTGPMGSGENAASASSNNKTNGPTRSHRHARSSAKTHGSTRSSKINSNPRRGNNHG